MGEPGISVGLVARWPEGDVARISDERDHTMSPGMCHRFSGETCVSLPKHLEKLIRRASEDLPTYWTETCVPRCDSFSSLASTGKAEMIPSSTWFRLPSGNLAKAAMAGLLLVLVLGSSLFTELFAAPEPEPLPLGLLLFPQKPLTK